MNAKLEVRDCLSAMNDNPTYQFIIDNRSLNHLGNVNPVKTLHRMSRIMGNRISYGLLSLNCDHVSQWLLTGEIEWTTQVWVLPSSETVPAFPLGQIGRDQLIEIEQQITEHNNIKSTMLLMQPVASWFFKRESWFFEYSKKYTHTTKGTNHYTIAWSQYTEKIRFMH